MKGTSAEATSPMRWMPPMITTPTSVASSSPKKTAPLPPAKIGSTLDTCA